MRQTKENSEKKSNTTQWLYATEQSRVQRFDVKRYLIPAVTAYGCGIGLMLSRCSEAVTVLSIYLVSVVTAVSVLMILCSIISKHRGLKTPYILNKKIILLAVVMLICFGLGSYRAYYAKNIQYKTLKDTVSSTVWVRGRVDTVPKMTKSGYNIGFVFSPTYMRNTAGEELKPVRGKIMLYLPKHYSDKIRRGDVIEGFINPEAASGARYENGYDYDMTLKQNGIPITAFAKSLTPSENTEKQSLIEKYKDLGFDVKQSIIQSVQKNFAYSADAAAILTGIMAGDKEGFSDELYEDFSRSGLMHIAAVSGMHVSYLVAILSFLMTKSRLKKSIIHILIIPFLLLFMSVASFTPSVCRAVIMTILFLLSYTIQKDPDQKVALFAAAGILLTFNPYLLFSAGFILSFGSVLAIQVFAVLIERRFMRVSEFLCSAVVYPPLRYGMRTTGGYIASGLAVSVASSLGIMYFATYFFNQLPLGGIITGLWVLPCVALTFVGGYALWLIDLIMPQAVKFLRIFLATPLEIIRGTAKLFAYKPFVIQTASPPKNAFIFYLIIMLILYVYLKYIGNFEKK